MLCSFPNICMCNTSLYSEKRRSELFSHNLIVWRPIHTVSILHLLYLPSIFHMAPASFQLWPPLLDFLSTLFEPLLFFLACFNFTVLEQKTENNKRHPLSENAELATSFTDGKEL